MIVTRDVDDEVAATKNRWVHVPKIVNSGSYPDKNDPSDMNFTKRFPNRFFAYILWSLDINFCDERSRSMDSLVLPYDALVSRGTHLVLPYGSGDRKSSTMRGFFFVLRCASQRKKFYWCFVTLRAMNATPAVATNLSHKSESVGGSLSNAVNSTSAAYSLAVALSTFAKPWNM